FQASYVEPGTVLERQIAAIWADVLKLEQVGLNDNFFELGGDSIISLQVVSRARQAGIRFTPKELFQHQTVQGLGTVARYAEEVFINQQPVTGQMPLTPIQHWFFAQDIPERHHWNQSVLLRPGRRIDPERLNAALHVLLEHHDALRLRLEERKGEWLAEFEALGPAQVLLTRQLNDDNELEPVVNEVQRSLNLGQGPLLAAALLALPDGSQRFLLVIHHLVVDGVSWRVLLEDLQQAYQQLSEGQTVRLPAKSSAFKTWAEHLQRHATSPALEQELEYWQQQLQDVSDYLPCHNPHASRQQKDAGYANTRLDKEWTRHLLQEAPMAYRTQVNDLLLAALARVISRWTGQSNVLVRLEGHGREDLFDEVDLTRTVGWFTSMYPVRLSPYAEPARSIKSIKEQLRAVPNKGIGYGLLRHMGNAGSQAILERLPQGEIVFNYLGQLDASFDDPAGLFALAKEGSGAAMAGQAPLASLLALNGQVYDGELSLDWLFSREVFDERTIGQLASEYADELKVLIAHCCDERNRGVTPSDFPLASLGQAHLDSLPIPATQIADIYPLSSMQQGILFHALYDHQGVDYVNQMRVDVRGLNVERFRQAWQDTVKAHDILRTAFVLQADLDAPIQVVLKQAKLAFTSVDLSCDIHPVTNLDELATQERAQCFVLDDAPLIRFVVATVGGDRCHLIYTSHHLLLDGWSGSNLLGELFSRYAGVEVPGNAGRFADFIAWHQRQDIEAAKRFWRAQLANVQRGTLISQSALINGCLGDARDRAVLNKSHRQVMDQALTSRLKLFARQHKVTVNTLVQSAWAMLLGFYTEQTTVVFGVTVAGRPMDMKEIENQIGLFINTLALVVNLDSQRTVGEWVAHVQDDNLKARTYEYISLQEAQRLTACRTLFDTVIIFENYPVSDAVQNAGIDNVVFEGMSYHEQTNYPITLYVTLGEELVLEFSYKALLDEQALARLGEQLLMLLEGMVTLGGQAALQTLQSTLGCSRSIQELPQGTVLRASMPDATGYQPPETERQKTLSLIWQSVLGCEKVGLDDNFFELGGDSLLSLKVLAKLRKVNDGSVQMALRDLFEKPTIRLLTS
uniref:condensation domain-containing protein n=1 Tax=Pseudomonas ovata TaxID=1839709 RepID=UPI001F4DA600